MTMKLNTAFRTVMTFLLITLLTQGMVACGKGNGRKVPTRKTSQTAKTTKTNEEEKSHPRTDTDGEKKDAAKDESNMYFEFYKNILGEIIKLEAQNLPDGKYVMAKHDILIIDIKSDPEKHNWKTFTAQKGNDDKFVYSKIDSKDTEGSAAAAFFTILDIPAAVTINHSADSDSPQLAVQSIVKLNFSFSVKDSQLGNESTVKVDFPEKQFYEEPSLKGPLTARSTSPQSALLAVDPKIIGGTARTIKDLKMEWTTTSAKELALHLQIFDPQIKMNVEWVVTYDLEKK